jgi:chaperonin GroEL
VRRALKIPARLIAENAGVDGSIVVGKLTDQKNASFGFDAQRGEYGDLVKGGRHRPHQGGAVGAAARRISRRTSGDGRRAAREQGRSGGAPGGMGGMGGGMGDMDF